MSDAAKGQYIRYVDLHKAFGDKQVLRGVQLDVRTGETLVVLDIPAPSA